MRNRKAKEIISNPLSSDLICHSPFPQDVVSYNDERKRPAVSLTSPDFTLLLAEAEAETPMHAKDLLKRKKVEESPEYLKNYPAQDTQDTSAELLECHENILTYGTFQENALEETKKVQENTLEDDIIEFLIKRESAYRINPFYLESRHPEINEKMMAVLIDWMMEVCMEFQLRRDTFHYSIHYVHHYLSLSKNVTKAQLQLVGLAALSLATKLEEVYLPRLSDFAKSAADGYTIEQIQEMEKMITIVLDWQLAPPTIFFWANWCAGQWDCFYEDEPMPFKDKEENSYIRYRQLMQLIDTLSLDVRSLQYNPRILAGSALYVLLSLYYGKVSINEILHMFTQGSVYLVEASSFNTILGNFIQKTLRLQLQDLLAGIQYVAEFMDMSFEYERLVPEEVKGNYEEFLTIQTYNRQQMAYIRSKIA